MEDTVGPTCTHTEQQLKREARVALFGVETCIMLHCDHRTTFSAVLLFNWTVLKIEKHALLFHLDRFGCILQIINMSKSNLIKISAPGRLLRFARA